MPQALSSKEQSLFRQVVKHYEAKQYKKGLKLADQVLKKSPNHGDTQAMKALMLNAQGQTDEAFALAKVALKNDMKSHVCWHVYGLLWRSAKNYEEAIKAYKFALKIEPESAQILRDLALLQAQMRDFQGYIQSRKQILQARPQLRQNWTAMAVAHHLAGELKAAETVLNTYEDTLKTPPPKADVEHAEAVLYKNTIIAEIGETERALDHLEAVKRNQLDKTAVMELRAKYLLQLERREEAETAYRDLLERNPEYRAYYEGLEQALSLDRATNKKELKELYGSYAQKHDRIDAARRLPMDFLEGEDFRKAADDYLTRMLTKGVPSTFNNVKSLYEDSEKRDIIQNLLHGYEKGAQASEPKDTQTNGDHPSKFDEAVLYFLAQHYNYRLSRDLRLALQYTETLIQLAPKTYDYTMTKARILKHLGNISEAAKVMDAARELDLRDRYINTKCAKYQLRNNDNEAALNTMSKFTRNETVGGPLGDLHEMQCLWYLTEDGEAWARRGRLGLALKRLHAVYDIFETWQEDQFDFHSFSLRKGQIRAYVDMVRWEDDLRKHPSFARVAMDATKVYLRLFDDPKLPEAEYLPEGHADMSQEDVKRAVKKAKKDGEKQDAEKIEADKKAAMKKANATEGEAKKVDKDPRGTQLVSTDKPLDVAIKFLNPLLEFGQESSEAQHLGFEVYIRRRKPLLALKCLLNAFAINSKDPVAHEQALRFRHLEKELVDESTASFIKDLTSQHLPAPYNSPDLGKDQLLKINSDVAAANPKSSSYANACALARLRLEPASSSEGQQAVYDSISKDDSFRLTDAFTGIATLKELGAGQSFLEKYVDRAREKWPEASVLAREAGTA